VGRGGGKRGRTLGILRGGKKNPVFSGMGARREDLPEFREEKKKSDEKRGREVLFVPALYGIKGRVLGLVGA